MYPIQIGTCGWSYKDWAGPFYPDGLPAGEYLAHYAARYSAVEVDSTFYHSPGRKLVEGWRDRTPVRLRAPAGQWETTSRATPRIASTGCKKPRRSL